MRRLRVLVAEDNDDHRFLTMRALQASSSAEVSVDAVADGEQLLQYLYAEGPYADRTLPNLIFLDLKMPKRGGLEVLERIKDDAELAAIPVIVLSSSDRQEDVDAAYSRGSNVYVTKPRLFNRIHEELRAITAYWTDRAALPGLAR